MATVYMMIGVQGSGKTTYSRMISKGMDIKIVSTDIVRDENPNMPERDVFPTVYKRCAELIKNGESLIFDATSIDRSYRTRFIENLRNNGVELNEYELVAIYFEPDLKTFTERVRKRNEDPNERFLPLEVVAKYCEMIEEPTIEEGFNQIIRIGKKHA